MPYWSGLIGLLGGNRVILDILFSHLFLFLFNEMCWSCIVNEQYSFYKPWYMCRYTRGTLRDWGMHKKNRFVELDGVSKGVRILLEPLRKELGQLTSF